jgi:hypothetical protein
LDPLIKRHAPHIDLKKLFSQTDANALVSYQ